MFYDSKIYHTSTTQTYKLINNILHSKIVGNIDSLKKINRNIVCEQKMLHQQLP